ncbi:unnamed protein product [Symbiodinium sp. CCMP2592]|nr:unnamed protein product [Symbiodinium sp. CCMP2592]
MVLKWDDAVTAARHCRGLQPGKQVTVLDEVDFAEYSARDQGRLLSINVPAQLCTVQFRGRRLPVEVPVRHLRLSHADELTESPLAAEKTRPSFEAIFMFYTISTSSGNGCDGELRSRIAVAPGPQRQSAEEAPTFRGDAQRAAAGKALVHMCPSLFTPLILNRFSIVRKRLHEELCASDWSDWKDLARGSPQGPRRSRSDSSGCRGPQVTDDTNLQPGVAALRDMLFVAAQPQDQLDTPSTVATDSPIDMIWSPRQRWVYEGPAQLVTELPGACRSPRPDSAMTPPRRTRAWLSNPPFSHRVEPQILLPPHTSPPRYAGLRPPGNLLGSISTLPTVTTARIKDSSSKQASDAGQEDGSRSADQALAQQKHGAAPETSPRRKPELMLEASNITVDPEPDVRREDEACSSGRSPIRQQIDQIQAESAEALRLLGAQRPDQFFGEMPVELEEAQRDDGEVQAVESDDFGSRGAGFVAPEAACAAADPVTTAGDAEDEVPLGEPQTAESEEVGSDRAGLVAAEAVSPVWNAEPYAGQGEDEAQMDDGVVESDDFGSRGAGFVAPEAACAAADPVTTAGDAEDEVPLDGGEPQTAESEEVGSDSAGLVAAEAVSPVWNAEPYAGQREDEAQMDDGVVESDDFGSRGAGFVAPEAACASADPVTTAGDAEDEVPLDGGEPQTAESEEVGSDSAGLVAAEAVSPVWNAEPYAGQREDEAQMDDGVVESDDFGSRGAGFVAPEAACASADPVTTAGDAEDEVPLDGGEPQTAESEEVGSDSAGLVAAEAVSPVWNAEPYAGRGEDEAQMDDGVVESDDFGSRGAGFVAPEAACAAADPVTTAGAAEDEVPLDGGEPQTAESEEVGSDSAGLVAAEAAGTTANPEPATGEDPVSMEEVGSGAGFILPEASAAACTGEDKVDEDNDFDEMEVESQLSSDSFRASPSPDEAALRDESSSEASDLEDQARSEISESAPRSRRGPTQSQQEECSSTWRSQTSGPAGPSSRVWQDAVKNPWALMQARRVPDLQHEAAAARHKTIRKCSQLKLWDGLKRRKRLLLWLETSRTRSAFTACLDLRVVQKQPKPLLLLGLRTKQAPTVLGDLCHEAIAAETSRKRSEMKRLMGHKMRWSWLSDSKSRRMEVSCERLQRSHHRTEEQAPRAPEAAAEAGEGNKRRRLTATMMLGSLRHDTAMAEAGAVMRPGMRWRPPSGPYRRILTSGQTDNPHLTRKLRRVRRAQLRLRSQWRAMAQAGQQMTRRQCTQLRYSCLMLLFSAHLPIGLAVDILASPTVPTCIEQGVEAKEFGWPASSAAFGQHAVSEAESPERVRRAQLRLRSQWRAMAQAGQQMTRRQCTQLRYSCLMLLFSAHLPIGLAVDILASPTVPTCIEQGVEAKEFGWPASSAAFGQHAVSEAESPERVRRAQRRLRSQWRAMAQAGQQMTRRQCTQLRYSCLMLLFSAHLPIGLAVDILASPTVPTCIEQGVEAKEFGWPASSAAFGQHAVSEAAEWPQDDMALAFGQETSKATSSSGVWPQDVNDEPRSPHSRAKAGEKSPASPAQPVARNGASWPTDDTPVEAKEFGWPASSAAFGQHAVSEAAEWPQDDMALAFGQETSKATSSSGVWPQDAFEWPTSQSQTPSAASGSFPPWAIEATVAAAPVQPEAGPKASEPEKKPAAAFLEDLTQSASPTRPTLRRSATQASSESPSKRSIGEDGAHSSSPSRRAQLRRSHTQGDSISPNRRTSTWGTAQARYGDDSGPNLKEDMAQFMPWGA